MTTRMKLSRAEQVATRGPKSEAQRLQAIKCLRRAARDLDRRQWHWGRHDGPLTGAEVQRDLRAAASRLAAMPVIT